MKHSIRFCLKIFFLGQVVSVLGFGQCTALRAGFLAFGDFGTGKSGQLKVARAMENFCKDNRCDFVALLGDNIYPNGVNSAEDSQWAKKFEEPYRELKVNFYPTLGNHDYLGNVEAQIEYSQFNKKWKFPSRYYSFTECFVDFFVLDTERFDEEQADWLQRSLLLSTNKWKIVIGHRPIFSYGQHGDNENLKERLLPLLKNRVDFYVSGHDHDLQHLKDEYRPEFIVSGAGSESRPVGKGKTTLFSASTEGFAHFDMTPDSVTLQFRDKSGVELYRKTRAR